MQTYLAHATPKNIGYLLIIAVVIWFAYKIATSPMNLRTRDRRADPETQRAVAAVHVTKILDGIAPLHIDLPQHKNQTPPAAEGEVFTYTRTPLPPQLWKAVDAAALEAEIQRQMMADTLRGTSLK